MTLQNKLDEHLYLAECARRDPSLLPNHGASIPAWLRRELAERIVSLDVIAGCADMDDFRLELESSVAAIRHALTAYGRPNVRAKPATTAAAPAVEDKQLPNAAVGARP